MRLALAQVNPTVGDIQGNLALIKDWAQRALDAGADVALFPELVLPGYPPEDLLLRADFVEAQREALKELVSWSRGKDIMLVVGLAQGNDELYNSAAVVYDGHLVDFYNKHYLPNYAVFDEKRYFAQGWRAPVYLYKGVRLGVVICEDVWHAHGPHRAQAVLGDAQVVLVLNASPYHMGKWRHRERMVGVRAWDNLSFFAYVNLVGGQDELVFDGGSFVVNPEGDVVARGRFFQEDLVVADIDPGEATRLRLHDPRWRDEAAECCEEGEFEVEVVPVAEGELGDKPGERSLGEPPGSLEEEVYEALKLGVRDYVRKNGFKKVLVGLSGGIDSALTAAVAADALGSENVLCLFMPSRFTSETSRRDARAVAERLGVELREIPIDGIFEAYLRALEPHFKGTPFGVAEENIQARIRGNLLMAFSNKFGYLVLTTGNKSELSVGYATLYGDMSGGFGVLKDVPKTLVYRLARYRNTLGEVFNESLLTKPPSAELRPNQRDEDDLPPYELLDQVVRMYVEEDLSVEEIVARGVPEAVARRVISMVDKNEYKRRQAPPGIRITPRAFGKDRRFPITNKFFRRA